MKNTLLLLLSFLFFTGCEFFLGSGNDYIYDQDGIPDEYETEGATYMGFPVYEWGARPQVTDIFIHVATMDYSGTDGGLLLQKAALDKVVAAFEPHNIAIHFDVGTTGLYDGITAIDSGIYNLSGESHIVPYNYSIHLSESIKTNYIDYATLEYTADESYEYVYVDQYKELYFPSDRNALFYFLVFGSSQLPPQQNGTPVGGSSGVSYIRGVDFLITLGYWGLNYDNSSMVNVSTNFQASTIMHEFGHTLGLLHGGDENLNYKPNYFSIMNYLYQLSGLPIIGNSEGDRYYYENDSFDIYGYYSSLSLLSNSPYTDTFIMDYSHGELSDLNESYLIEKNGLGGDSSGGIDWNLDGDTNDSGLSYNINPSYDYSLSNLHDYNDWDNLYFYFDNLSSRNGSSINTAELEVIVEEIPKFLKLKE